MIEVNEAAWTNYLDRLRNVNTIASRKMLAFIEKTPRDDEFIKKITDYAYALATKYGEAAAELACEMYDAIGLLEGLTLDAAVPAATATYGETAKSVRGAMKHSLDPTVTAQAVGRLVKMAAADTTLENAIRDKAQFAWIPHGDTCAFCIVLASNGWRDISKDALKDGHAEHIHANCDCQYAIRHTTSLNYGGYRPEEYKEIYDEGEGYGKNRINSIRRRFYEENKEKINAQKRDAYERSKELESPEAEEHNVN